MISNSKSNTMDSAREPHLDKAPRCGAKTRSGEHCKRFCGQRPDGTYKARCYYHGGAPGSGAPKGNKNSLGKQNALKSGEHTKEARERYKRHRKELKSFQETSAALLTGEPSAWDSEGLEVLFPPF